MTLKLYLMRHAEAENPGNKPDIDRELTEHGIAQAKEAGKLLQKHKISKILVSSSNRTMQTCNIVQKFLEQCPKDICPEIYKAAEEDILALISQLENKFQGILLIGHNPTIYNLALILSNSEQPEYDKLVQTGMHPARIVLIEFPEITSWQDVIDAKGSLHLL